MHNEWIERLKKVRKVVAHRNSLTRGCPDGTAAAMIVQDAFTQIDTKIDIVFAAYGPELDAIPIESGLLFVDISPPDAKIKAAFDAGALILDHHVTRRADVEGFERAGLGYYGDEKTSGALLAYHRVWSELVNAQWGPTIYDFARLASVRDTFQESDPEWMRACEQGESLTFYAPENWIESRPKTKCGWFNFSDALQARMAIGTILYAKKIDRAKHIAEHAFRLKTLAGTRLAVTNTLETTDAAREIKDADVLVGFSYEREPRSDELSVQFSLRAMTDYDVGAVAKKNGGGGHKAAAGFRVNDWRAIERDPIGLTKYIFDGHEGPVYF